MNHAFAGAAYRPDGWRRDFWRIDWILVRAGGPGLRVSTCRNLRDAAPPRFPSDHYPVVADVAVTP